MAQKRKDWNGLISGFKASDLVFLDESGCNTDMTRQYSPSQKGLPHLLAEALSLYSALPSKIGQSTGYYSNFQN